MKNFPIKYAPIIYALLFFSCGQKQQGEPVLATAGPKTLTLREFKDRAAFSPERLAVNPAPDKEQLLQLLISEKLLAVEAERQSIEKERINELTEFSEKLAVLRELFLTEVRQKVTLDSAGVNVALHRIQQERKISYLQFPDRSTAEEYLQKWRSSTFEQVVGELYGAEAEPAQNQRVYKWGDNDALLEEAIYALEVGELSPVISVPNGFLIVRCDDIVYTAADQTTQQNNARKIEQVLSARQEAVLSKRFVAGFMKNQNVRFDEHRVRLVMNAIVNAASRQAAVNNSDMKEIPLSDNVWRDALDSTENMTGETFVEFDGGALDAGEFLKMWRAYRFNVLKNPAACRKALNDQFSLVIRDHLMAREARRRGLAAAPTVKLDVQMWRDYYLSESITQQLEHDDLNELLQQLRQQHAVNIESDVLAQIELIDIPVIAMRPGQYTSRVTPPWPSFMGYSSTSK